MVDVSRRHTNPARTNPEAGPQQMETKADKDLAAAYDDLKRRYDDLVNRNPAGIFRTTLDGRFVECNDAMARIMGYDGREDLMRQPARELYHTDQDRQAYVEKLGRDKRLLNYEIRLKHKSGREVIALENVFLDEGPERETTILGMLQDITRIKQAETEQRALMANFRNLIEHIRDGLVVVQEGRVMYANPAAIDLFDATLIGARLLDRIHPSDREKAEAAMGSPDARSGHEGIRIKLLDHPERDLLLHCVSTNHQGKPAQQITLQDHTSQQRLIRERVKLQLAEEVNQVLREEIAGHRRTQEQLQRSKRFARNLIDSSLDMIMAADQDGRITEYNPAASIRFGYEPHEVVGLNTQVLYADPAEFERVHKEMDQHGVFAGEVRNIDKFGGVFTSYLAASRLFDDTGALIGAMGVSRDITLMKRDQEALRASEERYRDLFENATDLIQSVSPDGTFEYVNTAWRETLGYTAEEVKRLSVWDIVHPDQLDVCKNHFERTMRGEEVGSFRTSFRTKDGRAITVEGTANLRRADGQPAATRSIFRDITTVLVAQQQVMEHEAKLRALFESSEHMFWTIDPGLRLTSFNNGYGKMIERLYDKIPIRKNDTASQRTKFASEEYQAFWAEKYKQAFSGEPIRFETDLTDTTGRRVCNEIFLSPVFGANGEVVEVFGVGHEITEKKVAEDTIRAQAARLKAIFESSGNMMIWTLDQHMIITSCNAHFLNSIEEIHGIRFRVGDRFDERMATRIAPDRIKSFTTYYTNALRGKPQKFEVELIDLDGQPAWVENFLDPIIVEGRVEEIACLAYGITDRKQGQRELESSLAEKEVLLKEVHHRVKNNLQVISSIMKLQSERSENDDRILEVLHDSRDRIRSMALIHDSLYQNKQFSSIDLGNYIDGLARNLMLSYSTNERVALDLDLRPVHLNIDQAMPCGLILNEIISNALKHGYPGDRPGTVSIALREREGKVEITVKDNGKGLPKEFDEMKNGNLGMELIRMLVDQLDGRIERTSGPGVSYFLTFERI